MRRARHRRRPTAASRTICAFCRGTCGGTCAATATSEPAPDYDRASGHDVALVHAVDQVRGLVNGLGMIPRVAAKHVARRLAIDPYEVLVRVRHLRRLPAWWESPERPTSRPSRALNAATEEEEIAAQ